MSVIAKTAEAEVIEVRSGLYRTDSLVSFKTHSTPALNEEMFLWTDYYSDGAEDGRLRARGSIQQFEIYEDGKYRKVNIWFSSDMNEPVVPWLTSDVSHFATVRGDASTPQTEIANKIWLVATHHVEPLTEAAAEAMRARFEN